MKQYQLLCLFTIVLILGKSNINSTDAKKISKSELLTEGLNIPGFASKTIGNILSNTEISEDNQSDSFQMESELSSQAEAENSSSYASAISAEAEKPYLKDDKVFLQKWLSIQSKTFGDNHRYPEILTEDGNYSIQYNKNFERLNNRFQKNLKIPSKISFWFRLSKAYLYYAHDQEDINVLDRIPISNIFDLRWIEKIAEKKYCFNPTEKNKISWVICGEDVKEMTNWFCKLLKLTGLQKEDKCDPKNYMGALSEGKIVIKTVTQPIIIIPTASKYCNVGWTYDKHGSDWECQCKEGLEQSPIDLPPVDKSIETDTRPVFNYEFVDPLMTDDFAAARVKAGENNVIRYEEGALRIKHPNFGKIVTLDGAVYIAQEIVFHTPSEHTINGVRFDMEMQIIHYGKSIGDTLKTTIFSFLFRAKPGSFNKLIDKLDFFDLPNPHNKARELAQTLFIPHILLDSNEDDLSIMVPFSFYTYQGSLTAPPCSEKTIHYVASQPINLSNTALELFKEALRVPDLMDSKGNIMTSNTLLENNRATQPLNGRAIFHYDHTKFNCPDFRKKSKGINPKGHYEKRTKETTEYFFVNGYKPSGIPNSFVVPNKEALENM